MLPNGTGVWVVLNDTFHLFPGRSKPTLRSHSRHQSLDSARFQRLVLCDVVGSEEVASRPWFSAFAASLCPLNILGSKKQDSSSPLPVFCLKTLNEVKISPFFVAEVCILQLHSDLKNTHRHASVHDVPPPTLAWLPGCLHMITQAYKNANVKTMHKKFRLSVQFKAQRELTNE